MKESAAPALVQSLLTINGRRKIKYQIFFHVASARRRSAASFKKIHVKSRGRTQPRQVTDRKAATCWSCWFLIFFLLAPNLLLWGDKLASLWCPAVLCLLIHQAETRATVPLQETGIHWLQRAATREMEKCWTVSGGTFFLLSFFLFPLSLLLQSGLQYCSRIQSSLCSPWWTHICRQLFSNRYVTASLNFLLHHARFTLDVKRSHTRFCSAAVQTTQRSILHLLSEGHNKPSLSALSLRTCLSHLKP